MQYELKRFKRIKKDQKLKTNFQSGIKKALKALFSFMLFFKEELLLRKSTKTFVEFINTTTSFSSFLLTSVEWVTL